MQTVEELSQLSEQELLTLLPQARQPNLLLWWPFADIIWIAASLMLVIALIVYLLYRYRVKPQQASEKKKRALAQWHKSHSQAHINTHHYLHTASTLIKMGIATKDKSLCGQELINTLRGLNPNLSAETLQALTEGTYQANYKLVKSERFHLEIKQLLEQLSWK